MNPKGEALYTALTQVLTFIFGVFISILLNRTLGPTLKGELVLLLLIPQLIVSFINLGLGVSASYFMGKNQYPAQDIVKTNLFATLLLGAIGIAIGTQIFTKLAITITFYIKILVLSLIIWNLWLCYIPDFFLGEGRIETHNRWNLAQHIGRFFLLALFFALFKDKLSAAIIASTTSALLAFFLSFFIINSNGKINFSYLREGIAFGYKVFLVDLLGFINYRFDIILLKLFTNSTQIGYYSTATYMVEVLWLIPRAVSLALYSRLVTGRITKDEGSQIMRIALWVTAFLGIASIFFIKPVIKLFYGEKFLPAFYPYIILLPGIIALSLPKLLISEVVGKWGRPQIILIGRFITVAINITLNIVFIPRFGMNGAALASTIAYLLELIFFLFIYRKRRSILLPNLFRDAR